MASERTFTNADEERLSTLICTSRQRLVYAAPGVAEPIAKVLADRIAAADAPPQVVVILDPDPEVCRLGYGTLNGLETVRNALDQRGLQLQTSTGLRIGLLISDDQTLVYSPTPQLIEAGSTTSAKPNAILLKPDAPAHLAATCGLPVEAKPTAQQEIGQERLTPKQLEQVKENLKRNPPKRFDLARLERVFNYVLQFVEFKIA